MATLWLAVVATVILWIYICRALRKRRMAFLESLDPVKDRVAMNRLSLTVEFPWLSYKALEFTILKAVAIPSISSFIYTYEPQAAASAVEAVDPMRRYKATAMFGRQMLVSGLPAVLRQPARRVHGAWAVEGVGIHGRGGGGAAAAMLKWCMRLLAGTVVGLVQWSTEKASPAEVK